MRIAIVGTRGIPARYGGFETFAEELSTRLVQRGHQVAVYCRQPFPDRVYRGVCRYELPTIRHKYLDTPVHAFLSSLHLLRHRPDVALYCNAATAVFTLLPRIVGIPVALNVDGVERKRRKWNLLGKAWYWISEWLSTWCPNSVISDALTIQRYYLERFGKPTTYIPYGAHIGPLETTRALQQLGLERRRYFLYVSRMEPENNALLVRQAFERVRTDLRLVLVGDAPYAQRYIRKVRDTQDPRILFPGAIYGTGYHELLSHCYAYIHATEVGGTHPALVEAMGRGCLILYLETEENREVAGGAGIPFRPYNLSERIQEVLHYSEAEADRFRQRAIERARERYNWDSITEAYEKLFDQLVRRTRTSNHA